MYFFLYFSVFYHLERVFNCTPGLQFCIADLCFVLVSLLCHACSEVTLILKPGARCINNAYKSHE